MMVGGDQFLVGRDMDSRASGYSFSKSRAYQLVTPYFSSQFDRVW
jgi:hypothetical protein